MKILYSLLAVFFCFIQVLYAQRAIKGKVIDGFTKHRIEGASVTIPDSPFGCMSADRGKFSMNIPDTATVIRVSCLGYLTQLVTVQDFMKINLIYDTTQAYTDQVWTLLAVNIIGSTTVQQKLVTSGSSDDPLQLLQGKVPGLLMARAGSNPNEAFTLRLRGLTTFVGDNAPAVWMNGIPIFDIDLLNPHDIGSATIFKDAFITGAYGNGSANGIIAINTRPLPSDNRLHLTYSGGISLSAATRLPKVMNAEAFLRLPGAVDFSAESVDTDWQATILRKAVSHTHHIGLSIGHKRSMLSAGLGYVSREGILQGSQYTQYQANILAKTAFLKDRVRLECQWLGSQKEANLSFEEAFRYAISANPTMPIHITDGQSRYGKFHEFSESSPGSRFDLFNPVAILEQNKNLEDKFLHLVRFESDVKLTQLLQWKTKVAYQYQGLLGGELNDIGSKFRGEWNKPRIVLRDEAKNQIYAESGLESMFFTGKIKYIASSKFIFQKHNFNINTKGGKNHEGRVSQIYQTLDIFNVNVPDFVGTNPVGVFIDQKTSETYKGGLLQIGASKGNIWHWVMGTRSEIKASNIKDLIAFSPFIYGGYNLNKRNYWKRLSILVLRGGLGSSPESAEDPAIEDANSWSYRSEFSLGLDWLSKNQRFRGNIDCYMNINFDYVSKGPFVNEGNKQILNRGIEISTQAVIIKKQKISWSLGLNYTVFGSNVKSIPQGYSSAGYPSRYDLPYHHQYDGNNNWGQISGYKVSGFKPLTYQLIYQQSNGKPATYDALAENKIFGNGIPSKWLGLQSDFQFKDFELNVQFRAVLGHDIIHENRLFYENGGVQYNVTDPRYNSIITKYFDPNRGKIIYFAPEYVEKASFLRLDELRLSYYIYRNESRQTHLQIYVGAQNLFTITKYTGSDPEVRLKGDIGPLVNGNRPLYPADPLAVGIARRGGYGLEKTMYLGVKGCF